MSDASSRSGLDRRQLIVGGALLATAGTAWARTPRTAEMAIRKGELEGAIPLTIGDWSFETKSGLVLPPPDELAAKLYDQTLTRTYNSPTDLPIMLLIAYGSSQNGMLQVHRPETCYPAGGYTLSATDLTQVSVPGMPVVPTRFFTAVSDARVEQLMYWTRIGHFFPQRWIEQRWAVMRNNLNGVVPDGVLVRMSTITTDRAAAEAAIKRFAATMVAAAPPKGKALLLGTTLNA